MRLFVIVLAVLSLALFATGLGAAADLAAQEGEATYAPGDTPSPTAGIDLFGAGTVTPESTGTPEIEPQETVTPTVRAGSPTPQATREQQLVQVLPQIYDQFDCYGTVTTVRWNLENGSRGVAVITGKIVTNPLAQRWNVVVRRQGQLPRVIEIVRAEGQTYARTTDATGTTEWSRVTPTTLQVLSQFSWVADLSALLNVNSGELVGQTTVNDMTTNHYRFTRQQIQISPQSFDVRDASADVWFSTDHNVPVKSIIRLQGTNILGSTGDVIVRSQLTDVNDKCEIQLPLVPTETPQAQMEETGLILADALGLSEFESYQLQSSFEWVPEKAHGFSGGLNAQVTYDIPAEHAILTLQNVRVAAFPTYMEYVDYRGATYIRIGSDGEWMSAEDLNLTSLLQQLGRAINPLEFFQADDCELVEQNVQVNGQMTDHYRCVTQQAEGQPFFERVTQATVDIWSVQDSDAYVRMQMSVQGETAQGTSGVFNLRANVTNINEPVSIQEPQLGMQQGVGTPSATGSPTIAPTGTRTPGRTGTPSGTARPTGFPTGTRTPGHTGTPSGTATLSISPTITLEGTPASVYTTTQGMDNLPWDDDWDDSMPFMMQSPTPEQQSPLTPTPTQATPSTSMPRRTPQQLVVCPLPFLIPCEGMEASYMVDISSQQVLQFYNTWMIQMGWTQVATQVENGIVFEMGGRQLLVTAIEVDGRTVVHLAKLPSGAASTATPSAQ